MSQFRAAATASAMTATAIQNTSPDQSAWVRRQRARQWERLLMVIPARPERHPEPEGDAGCATM